MELKELIERAEEKLGSQKALGEYIGQATSTIRSAKAGICGLPGYACALIADLIGEDKITVIAASELVTEKKEERRKVWQKCLTHVASVAMVFIILNMSPTPAEASQDGAKSLTTMYIMSNARRMLKWLATCFSWFQNVVSRIAPLPAHCAG